MPQQEYQLREVSPGVYSRSAPALVMVGPWGLSLPDNSARWRSLHRAHRRPGERLMDARQIGLRLLASLIALGCGIAALVVAILLVRGVVA